MTPAEAPKKRDYQKHAHYTLSKALKTIGNQDGWMESLGDVGEALKAWKQAIIDDLGGETEVSAMELSVIELACKTHLLLASVDRFLLEQRSLINKSKRQLFPIVVQRQVLADALSAYMKQLGMKKKSKPVLSLSDYLSTNGKHKIPTPSSPSVGDAHLHTPRKVTPSAGMEVCTPNTAGLAAHAQVHSPGVPDSEATETDANASEATA